MRWSPAIAEAMVLLQAIYLSGDWDECWEWPITKDRERRYRTPPWRVVDEK